MNLKIELLRQFIEDGVKVYTEKYSKKILLVEGSFTYCPDRNKLNEKYIVTVKGTEVIIKSSMSSIYSTFSIKEFIRGDDVL